MCFENTIKNCIKKGSTYMMSEIHSTLKLGKGFVKIFVCLTSTIKRYSKLRKAFSLSKSFISPYKNK